jgi:hypothetical protein
MNSAGRLREDTALPSRWEFTCLIQNFINLFTQFMDL